MKRIAFGLAATLLLVCGCNSDDGSSAPTSEPSVAGVPTTERDPNDLVKTQIGSDEERSEICSRLLEDDGGIFNDTSGFLETVREMSPDNVERARTLSMSLGFIASATPDTRMASLIREMQRPFEEHVEAYEQGQTWTFDGAAFKEASFELLDICEAYESTWRTPPAEAAPEPPTAASRLIPPTTGNYEADLRGLGVVPDSFPEFRKYISQEICDSPRTGYSWELMEGRLRSLRTDVVNEDVLRLHVAYDCPDRAQDLEEALQRLDARDRPTG